MIIRTVARSVSEQPPLAGAS